MFVQSVFKAQSKCAVKMMLSLQQTKRAMGIAKLKTLWLGPNARTQLNVRFVTDADIKAKMLGAVVGIKDQTDQVIQVINDSWNIHSNLKFNFFPIGDMTAADVVVNFNNKITDASALGTESMKRTKNSLWTVNLGNNRNKSSTDFPPQIMHEFGHALGVYHEHQSPYTTKIISESKMRAWYTKEKNITGKAFDDQIWKQFRPLGPSEFKITTYDDDSIMRYNLKKDFLVDESLYTDKVNIVLSAGDIAFVNQLYPMVVKP
jgi:hypothetical protein